jgi:hypothetical protein
MMRAASKNRANLALPVRSIGFAAAILVGASCTENLPSGPDTFGATIKILVAHDTIVVGDSSTAQAQALDASGRAIQGLKFNWTSAATPIVDFATPATENVEVTEGRTRTMVGKFPGRSLVTMTLPDSRFVTTATSRNQTVVVGGVRILSTHDSTLTAVNDTVRAIAAGLVRVNGALVTRASQGIKWTHKGTHTDVIGSGDTIRYIARSNGADTIIATHDFCLFGAKCADTAVVRVNQQLSLTLSSRTFAAWSFSDTLGPTITLADRRGNGLPGASIRFVPATAFDSLVVKVVGPFGVSNSANGLMAAPKLVSAGNGIARVAVQGIGADGFTVVALDSIFETVRQVARRVQVEPLRANLTSGDSIPIRPVARDARGVVIADATITTTPTGIPLNGIWTGPIFPASAIAATITPTLTGVALPAANPAAPQIPVAVDDAIITVFPPITVIAGATQVAVNATLLDSLGQPAFNKFLRFGSPATLPPDSVQADGAGGVNLVWTPRDSAGTYTLTGVRGAATPLLTFADSAGRIVVRRTVTVVADIPAASRTTLAISATSIPVNGTATVTVRVNDRFGNPVKTATAASFSAPTSTAGGTFGAITCVQGVCAFSYTAPAAAGPDFISVKILGVEIAFSPIGLTIF